MDKIILFGAGKNGKIVYDFLQKAGMADVIECFCDNSIEFKNKQIGSISIYNYEQCKDKNNDFVITTTKYEREIEKILQNDNKTYFHNITEWASFLGIDKGVGWNRAYCAWVHNTQMDNYFDEAESDASMKVFWDEASIFYKMFMQLDLDNVIELAAGHGRHVRMYAQRANHIMLVDILQKNIDICKERFKNDNRIDYYCNNGYNLSKLNDNEYSSLFTYASMVHFEMMDIFEYLKDIYRVLKKGGLALLHHSNNTSSYKSAFVNALYGRSYMSKQLFAYLAYRAGFEIVEQHVIDAIGVKELDCVSLIRKV